MKVSFVGWANQDDAVLATMRQTLARRDLYAPLYITYEQKAAFEARWGLRGLREKHLAVTAAGSSRCPEAKRVTGQIQFLLDRLENLQITESREAYFKEVNTLRAAKKSTAHLHNIHQSNQRPGQNQGSSAVAAAIATSIDQREGRRWTSHQACRLPDQGTRNENPVRRPRLRVEAGKAQPPPAGSAWAVKCLLYMRSFTRRSDMTKHVRDHHRIVFNQPFS